MLGTPFDPILIAVLIVIAFISGIGITTIGPGGIFVTIALYSLTSISSGQVAGTAHATFIATGVVGTLAYIRSGEIGGRESWMMAGILSLASIGGALLGSGINAYVPRQMFGILLGVFSMAVGAIIIYRERKDLEPVVKVNTSTYKGKIGLGALGLTLGICSGLLGVGGPVLAVPALVLVGVPMLIAVAVAQVQSIFIAVFAASGYYLQGNVSSSLAILVGTPLLLGVVAGWRVAHMIDPDRLKGVLGLVLIAVGPYLAL